MNVHLHKPQIWPYGFDVAVSIYRNWARDRGWTTGKTYHYLGGGLAWHWRWGRHVDSCGRVYLYVGPLTLWQDIWRATPNRIDY